jgi:hypothetical protein
MASGGFVSWRFVCGGSKTKGAACAYLCLVFWRGLCHSGWVAIHLDEALTLMLGWCLRRKKEANTPE